MTSRGVRTVRWHTVSVLILFCAAGCTIKSIPSATREEVRQIVETATKQEERCAIGKSVDELKIALTIDPDNTRAREELHRLVAIQDKEANAHVQTGSSLRDSNPQKAQKELIAALKLRPDHSEALAALRELTLIKAEAKIQARLKKEAAVAAAKEQGKHTAAEEDEDAYPEDYSLEVAISAFNAGDYKTAIREFEKMKANYPNDPDIQAYLERSWYNNGVAYYNKKDCKNALAAFAKVRKGFERVDEYTLFCQQQRKAVKKKK